MILDLAPVLFHSSLYQCFNIPATSSNQKKKSLGILFIMTAQSAEVTDVQANHKRYSSLESTFLQLFEYSL